MTQTAALCKVLLGGESVSIKNAYFELGISNIAREIGRSIERKFGVTVSKTKMTGTHRFGGEVHWYSYRLNPMIEGNAEGIKKMVQYLIEQGAVEPTGALTDKERMGAFKEVKQNVEKWLTERESSKHNIPEQQSLFT